MSALMGGHGNEFRKPIPRRDEDFEVATMRYIGRDDISCSLKSSGLDRSVGDGVDRVVEGGVGTVIVAALGRRLSGKKLLVVLWRFEEDTRATLQTRTRSGRD